VNKEKTHLHDTMIFWKQIVRMQLHKRLNARELAPRARFEPATLRLTAEKPTSSELAGVGALIEGNLQVAMKPDESFSPSLFTFHSHFAAICHH
jgi:hypothetical protein